MSPRWGRRENLRKRNVGSGQAGSQVAIVIVVSIALAITLAVATWIVLKTCRKRYPDPRYIPTTYLKRKWEAWRPGGFVSPKQNQLRLRRDGSVPTLLGQDGVRGSRHSMLHLPNLDTTGGAENSATVNRHESTRSVATLPAYSRSVRENERVLGREGEREGIDAVLEFPETQEEEEARREGEMENLYQIREHRRQEAAERQDRRRARREARQTGDLITLRRLQEEARLRAEAQENSAIAALMADYRSRERERRASSVAYGDLGVARHDGTRIRAPSQDSYQPLLADAASIGGGSLRPWISHEMRGTHACNRSVSSVMSISDDGTSVALLPAGTRRSDVEGFTRTPDHSRNTSRIWSQLGEHSRGSTAAAGNRSLDSAEVDLADGQLSSSGTPLQSLDHSGEALLDDYREPSPHGSSVPAPSELAQPSPRERAVSPNGAPLLPEFGRFPSLRIADFTAPEVSHEAR